ncbi:hypothetical protein M440DRAFT_1015162 [Trichoderma longibrachiatum ATCC 18648]|uniref:Uncharacterized protein n=1 Tax=Trichoderma longibrachiatum ATCC 18648 TaxID=983965 RepID=A0A2T4CIP9_TRILO|nr:hypothetical protein M440DRAFT_1015162 [Trichoderma longibrachiatum ATCC 18648]
MSRTNNSLKSKSDSVSAAFARVEKRLSWPTTSQPVIRNTSSHEQRVPSLPCASCLSSTRFGASTSEYLLRHGAAGPRMRLLSILTHACRYAERRRLGWGEGQWWLLQAVETLRLGRKALAATNEIPSLLKRRLAA